MGIIGGHTLILVQCDGDASLSKGSVTIIPDVLVPNTWHSAALVQHITTSLTSSKIKPSLTVACKKLHAIKPC